jgi:formate/nitrite transporter FocA (FNT family)
MTTEATYATDVVTDEQWDAIDRRLDGNLVDEDRSRQSKRRRNRVTGAIGLAVLALFAGVLVALLIAPDDGGRSSASSHSDLQSTVGIAAFAVAMVVWAIGLVVVIRGGGIPLAWKEPTEGVPRAERRAIERGLLGRVPVNPSRTRTLRRLAMTRLHQAVWAVWLVAGQFPLAIGQATTHWGTWLGAVFLVLAAVWAAGLVAMAVRRRRLRTFLATHPPVGGDPASAS